MSKTEIWEAVLELKRGRILRDYSNENLSEASFYYFQLVTDSNILW